MGWIRYLLLPSNKIIEFGFSSALTLSIDLKHAN